MTVAPITNLDYVILLCGRLAETRTFYLETMRFPLEMDRAEWVSFRVGSGLLTLRPRGPCLGWDDGPALVGSAAVQLAFRVPPSAITTGTRADRQRRADPQPAEGSGTAGGTGRCSIRDREALCRALCGDLSARSRPGQLLDRKEAQGEIEGS